MHPDYDLDFLKNNVPSLARQDESQEETQDRQFIWHHDMIIDKHGKHYDSGKRIHHILIPDVVA